MAVHGEMTWRVSVVDSVVVIDRDGDVADGGVDVVVWWVKMKDMA